LVPEGTKPLLLPQPKEAGVGRFVPYQPPLPPSGGVGPNNEGEKGGTAGESTKIWR